MKEYVLGFCCVKAGELYGPEEDQAIFIHKNRPAWQAGKINLPGGAIEEGETPEEAIIREFEEETGLNVGGVEKVGEMRDRDFRIHCLNILWTVNRVIQPRPEETEKVEWMDISLALRKSNLIPNLRVIIPLIMCGVKGWTVLDSATPALQPHHTISVTVPTYVS